MMFPEYISRHHTKKKAGLKDNHKGEHLIDESIQTDRPTYISTEEKQAKGEGFNTEHNSLLGNIMSTRFIKVGHKRSHYTYMCQLITMFVCKTLHVSIPLRCRKTEIRD